MTGGHKQTEEQTPFKVFIGFVILIQYCTFPHLYKNSHINKSEVINDAVVRRQHAVKTLT